MHTTFARSRLVSQGILAFFVTLVVAVPARAAAQEPVRSFDQLNTRLKVGDTVWVTDASGREVKGKLSELSTTSLTLSAGEDRRSFQGPDVRAVVERPRDSLKFGALLGLGIGIGTGLAITVAVGDADVAGAALGIGMLGAMGAGIGAGIDAAIPMPKRPVYLSGRTSAKRPVSWGPMIGRHSTGVVVSFGF
jgi:hypothetical protein